MPDLWQPTRVGAWEGKDLGSIRVLQTNPRWKRRFLKFLELSGVVRVVVDGTDVERARAARMDEWIVWEGHARAHNMALCSMQYDAIWFTQKVIGYPIDYVNLLHFNF